MVVKKQAAAKPTRSAAKKSTAKKPTTTARKTAAKPAAASASKRKPNAAFMKPMKPSAHLALIVGASPMPRTEVTSKLWEHIKKHRLQDSANKRMINADDKLRPIFGRSQVSMFEMVKLVSKHLS